MSEGGWTKQEGESYAIYYNNCVEECLNNYYYFTCCLLQRTKRNCWYAPHLIHHSSLVTSPPTPLYLFLSITFTLFSLNHISQQIYFSTPIYNSILYHAHRKLFVVNFAVIQHVNQSRNPRETTQGNLS